MTIGAIIGGVIATITIAGMAVIFLDKGNKKKSIAIIVASVIVVIAIWGGMIWYYQNTASGARAIKTQESNFSRGLERHIRIYDINGKLLEEYKGKLDIEYDDDGILFDDENGLRHIIYYGQDTVLVDEIATE